MKSSASPKVMWKKERLVYPLTAPALLRLYSRSSSRVTQRIASATACFTLTLDPVLHTHVRPKRFTMKIDETSVYAGRALCGAKHSLNRSQFIHN
jgi:hypothetical protein